MAALLLLGTLARSATLTVGPQGTYATVQEAIDAAQTGDTISIDGAGSPYVESLVVSTSDLVLVGDGDVTVTATTLGPALSTHATVTVAGITLDGGLVSRALDATAATVSLEAVELRNGTAPVGAGGGVVRVDGADLTMEACLVETGYADDDGGLLWARNATLDIADTTFVDGHTGGSGSIRAMDTDLWLDGVTIAGPQEAAMRHGLVATSTGPASVTIANSTLTWHDSEIYVNGVVDVHDTALGLTFGSASTATFDRVEWNSYGLGFQTTGDLFVVRSTFCALGGSPVYFLFSYGVGGTATIAANRILECDGDPWYPPMVYSVDLGPTGAVRIENNLFHAQPGKKTEGVLVDAESGTIRNNVFLNHSDEATVVAGPGVSVGYNYFANDEETGSLDPTSVGDGDMVWTDAADLDGACPPDPVYPSWDGPLREMGDPALTNPDGSRSDLGPWGGPFAHPEIWVDSDHDGVAWIYDCDDMDPDRSPAHTVDWCDGIDNDCDGVAQDDAMALVYPDLDEDGFGDDSSDPTSVACEAGPLESVIAGDCDDGESAVHPGAAEVCNGVDDDCDRTTDVDAVDPTTFYADFDGDGWGDANAPLSACSLPEGAAETPGDCADLVPSIHPDAEDVCNDLDDDCDDEDDEDPDLVWYRDADGDLYGDPDVETWACARPLGWVANPDDCNDQSGGSQPGQPEFCDGLDNDCDGVTDEGESQSRYADRDEDGWGDPSTPTTDCDPPWPTDTRFGDCDDLNFDRHPEADELCNGVDDDCNGVLDEDLETTTFWEDPDGDGFRATNAGPIEACAAPPAYGLVDPLELDCEGSDPDTYPGAAELCDGVDNDCDGEPDEGTNRTIRRWRDGDGDGYGAEPDLERFCAEPPEPGWVDDDDDCDDGRASVHPGAEELCNGIDDDCDGIVDEGTGGDLTAYWDNDKDGFGEEGSDAMLVCSLPEGYAAFGGDCDDENALRHPLRTEECNGVDDDCDGIADEGYPMFWAYADEDEDGHGGETAVLGCELPEGTVLVGGDCDDGAPKVHPGADDSCNGRDDDCDGSFDEDAASTAYWPDADGDGYGDRVPPPTWSCAPLDAYATNNLDCDDDDDAVWGIDADGDGRLAVSSCGGAGDDCDDTDANVNPYAPERCNGADDDCDGDADEGLWADEDGDGFGAGSCPPWPEDCDDLDPLRYPGASDPADGIDQDCDGVDGPPVVDPADDADGDGYATRDGDCNDADPDVAPDAVEVCDGIDDDCDGYLPTDEWDLDGDGWRVCEGDCDDLSTLAHPWLAENCGDSIDNDCNGTADADADEDGDGWTDCDGDCRDEDLDVHPAATEVCNGLDDDCDGDIDEGNDRDADGWSDCACRAPPCDCADEDARTHPGRTEDCLDGIDNDCDGTIDVSEDGDRDGLGSCEGDCDDVDPYVRLGSVESCDRKDNDCDGTVDEGYDADTDGVSTCLGDCDDADQSSYPGAVEECDGEDDDCDALVDEAVCETDTGGDSRPSETRDPSDAPGGPASCFCRSTSAPPSGIPVFVLLAFALVRRFRALGGLGWLAAAPAALAETRTVGPNSDYPDVPSAVEAADPGDVIEIEAGTFAGAVRIGKDLTLRGAGDHDTILVAGVEENVVEVQVAEVVLEDLMLDGDFQARGLSAVSAIVSLSDVFIWNGAATDGPSIHADASEVTLTSSYLERALPTGGDGGHIWAGFGSLLSLEQDTTVAYGIAHRGGGLYLEDSELRMSEGSHVSSCTADEGGGIYATSSDLDLRDAYIVWNRAIGSGSGWRLFDGSVVGWGVYIETDQPETTTLSALGASVDLDHVNLGGGSVSVLDALVVDLDDVRACGSRAGAAIRLDDVERAAIRHAVLATGDSDPQWAWIDVTDTTVSVSYSTFFGAAAPFTLGGSGFVHSSRNVFATTAATSPTTSVQDLYAGTDAPDHAVAAWTLDAAADPFHADPALAPCDPEKWALLAEYRDRFTDELDPDGSPAGLGHLSGPDPMSVNGWEWVDDDGDGWINGLDCATSDATISPGAPEDCTGAVFDQNCDGVEDDGVPVPVYTDADGDGYGVEPSTGTACMTSEGTAFALGDCDDTDAAVHPDALDLCDDSIDQDCTGTADDDPLVWFSDADGDGWGETATAAAGCDPPEPTGWSTNWGDCDDGNASVHPAATETCYDTVDQNCDGSDDAFPNEPQYPDEDGDGYGDDADPIWDCDPALPGFADNTADCDDAEPAVFPGAPEPCNGIDDDCNGFADDDTESWWPDLDLDSFGDAAAAGVNACEPPQPGWVRDSSDCDDGDASVRPNALEDCNGRDDDCDHEIDEFLPWVWAVPDQDGDGYGANETPRAACALGSDEVLDNYERDCDDDDPTVHPHANEICDEKDQDCDGVPDVPIPSDASAWFWDADGDGYGWGANRLTACDGPPDFVLDPTDCDDAHANVHPGADEQCNGRDDDCDERVDEKHPASTWYVDADADDHGDPLRPVEACGSLAGLDDHGDDCNDADPAVNPDAGEVCNGVDDDCDGAIDEALGTDDDQDGYHTPGGCLPDGDCDDAFDFVHPSAPEACNGIDDDCDGGIDDGLYADADADGYRVGTCLGGLPADCDDTDAQRSPAGPVPCSGGSNPADPDADRDGDGATPNQGDCDDGDATVGPTAPEACNGRDDDCDGFLPYEEADWDGDHVRACDDPADCDDLDPSARPWLAEDCTDGIDNNCSGDADEDADLDSDGITTCQGDCADFRDDVHPEAPEACNTLDDDCDGTADEDLDQDRDGVLPCDCGVTPCDCDDANALVAPDAWETCGDGTDNNCDGEVDESGDADFDGVTTCDGDCDDHDPFVGPGAVEVCDLDDNDCDGLFDEGLDRDGDGLVPCRGDCVEGDASIWLGAPEVCDHRDNDCDGAIDEGVEDDCGDTDTDTDGGETDETDLGWDTSASGGSVPPATCACRSGGFGSTSALVATLLATALSRRRSSGRAGSATAGAP